MINLKDYTGTKITFLSPMIAEHIKDDMPQRMTKTMMDRKELWRLQQIQKGIKFHEQEIRKIIRHKGSKADIKSHETQIKNLFKESGVKLINYEEDL